MSFENKVKVSMIANDIVIDGNLDERSAGDVLLGICLKFTKYLDKNPSTFYNLMKGFLEFARSSEKEFTSSDDEITVVVDNRLFTFSGVDNLSSCYRFIQLYINELFCIFEEEVAEHIVAVVSEIVINDVYSGVLEDEEYTLTMINGHYTLSDNSNRDVVKAFLGGICSFLLKSSSSLDGFKEDLEEVVNGVIESYLKNTESFGKADTEEEVSSDEGYVSSGVMPS